MLSSLVEGHQCFGGNCCLLPSITLKMEIAISSKMLVSTTKVQGVTSQKTIIVTHYAYMICKFLGSCSSAVYGSVLLGYGIMSMGLCRHIPEEQKYPDKISVHSCSLYIFQKAANT